MNDYEMMRAAGFSVAMGNACEELKRIADTVCKSVWEDGIITNSGVWEFARFDVLY